MGQERDTGDDARVVLAAPVRARLTAVAADVLGTLNAEEVPARLRVAARFTPRRRARLAGPALLAELHHAGGFRGAVAAAVTAAEPDLAGAVGRGEVPDDADEVDVAVLAFLLRPDGWADLVGLVADPPHEPDAERQRLQAQVDRLDRERADHRQRLAEARAETQAVRAELTDVRMALRRSLRAHGSTHTLRREQQRRVGELEEQLEAVRADFAAKAEDLRAQLDTAHRELESVQADGRLARRADDTRLWLLLETAGGAIAGLRRELGVTADGPRPADTVATGGQTVSDRIAADPQDLDRLLALPRVHLVVDGYNVTKSGYPSMSLADQRHRLSMSAAALAARTGAEITLVFDGADRPLLAPPSPRGVRVVFSAKGRTADELIRRMVAAEPEGRPVVVVSTDREVAAGVRRPSVWTIDSAAFLQRIGRT